MGRRTLFCPEGRTSQGNAFSISKGNMWAIGPLMVWKWFLQSSSYSYWMVYSDHGVTYQICWVGNLKEWGTSTAGILNCLLAGLHVKSDADIPSMLARWFGRERWWGVDSSGILTWLGAFALFWDDAERKREFGINGAEGRGKRMS